MGQRKKIQAVRYTLEGKDKKPCAPKKRDYVPNAERAVTSGSYAVIVAGRRMLVEHKSGEPLKGKLL